MPSQEQPRNRKSSRCRIRAVAIDALVKSKSRQKRQRKEPLPPPPLKEANQESRSSAAPSWAACEAVQPETLARRLACGHTKEARLLLEQTRLFHFDGADDLPEKSGLQQPCRGLQADYLGDRVYILDTYNRRGKLQADVAPIRPGRQPGKFVLGTNKNASGSDLTNLGNDFILSIGARGRPELRRCSPDAEPRSTGVLGHASQCWGAACCARAWKACDPGRCFAAHPRDAVAGLCTQHGARHSAAQQSVFHTRFALACAYRHQAA